MRIWDPPATSSPSAAPLPSAPPSPPLSQPNELFTPGLIGKTIMVIGKNKNPKHKLIPVIPRVADGERYLERPGFRSGVQRIDYEVTVYRPGLNDNGLWLVAEGPHVGKFVRGKQLRRPRGGEEYWNVAIVTPRNGLADAVNGEADIRADQMLLAHEDESAKTFNEGLVIRLSPESKPKRKARK
jgi:hypothetical protein